MDGSLSHAAGGWRWPCWGGGAPLSPRRRCLTLLLALLLLLLMLLMLLLAVLPSGDASATGVRSVWQRLAAPGTGTGTASSSAAAALTLAQVVEQEKHALTQSLNHQLGSADQFMDNSLERRIASLQASQRQQARERAEQAGDSHPSTTVAGEASLSRLDRNEIRKRVNDHDVVVITFARFDPSNPKASMKNVRRIVGSVHETTLAKSRVVLYLQHFPKAYVSEIGTYQNVEVVDVVKEFISSFDQSQGSPLIPSTSSVDWKPWLPIIIHHAVDKYLRVLFVHSDHYLKEGWNGFIDSQLRTHGHFFRPWADGSQFGDRVMGFTAGSEAFEELIEPRVQCTRSVSKTCESLPPFKVSIKALSQKMGKEKGFSVSGEAFVLESQGKENKDCHIRHHEVWAFSPVNAGSLEANPHGKNDDRIRVAMGIPTTSKGSSPKSPNDLPLFSILLNSLLPSVTEDEKRKYTVELYVGFDENDPYWDNETNLKSIHEEFQKKTAGSKDTFRMELIRFRQSFGWTSFIWNGLFEHSLIDGCQYYYQINDDVKIMSPGWITAFVDTLQKSPIRPNFGLTGPLDVNNNRILTQTFVHKTHFDIFHKFFPWEFQNWFNDDWATGVYERSNGKFWRKDIKVQNTNAKGTRYDVCHAGGNLLKDAKARGEEAINRWLDAHPMEGYPKRTP